MPPPRQPALLVKVLSLLADVPACKHDLVADRYELAAPPSGAEEAVMVIDMLGEECLVRLTA